MKKHGALQRKRYIDMMEKTLAAYSLDDIDRYCNEVAEGGLKEHGFPRLTSVIGILLCHGRRKELLGRFVNMMDLCCSQMPNVKAGNDFTVKEIIFCLMELEKCDLVSQEKQNEWKAHLAGIRIENCYSVYATKPDSKVFNWAAFTMVSEWMRGYAGLTKHDMDFIDCQACSQLQWVDENGMYRDPNEPMVYDLATRGLVSIMFHFGYRGKYHDIWDKHLETAGLKTLNMISVTGELPYGGRSNQFLHNEAHCAFVMEYEAGRYARLGNMKLAGQFKATAERSLKSIEYWLGQHPITHVKNHFPRNTGYGCETYAYFDKYMITTASFLYACYLVSDESIPIGELSDEGSSWLTSRYFHKLFMKAGDYCLEYDYKADTHYDASGLGRLHYKNAPSEICLSCPCPHRPNYNMGTSKSSPLTIVPAVRHNNRWLSGANSRAKHEIVAHKAETHTATAHIQCTLPGKNILDAEYTLSKEGLKINITGEKHIGCLLPAFDFDGRDHTIITHQDQLLEIHYHGYVCRYRAIHGIIRATKQKARNRNGHYNVFRAEGNSKLTVMISIEPEQS